MGDEAEVDGKKTELLRLKIMNKKRAATNTLYSLWRGWLKKK